MEDSEGKYVVEEWGGGGVESAIVEGQGGS